ncbi:MAG: exo-alpha-sialidase [Planctomycetes bacterium]|nr:exo-alpha-sialidase [Planctomycetota bacterium]
MPTGSSVDVRRAHLRVLPVLALALARLAVSASALPTTQSTGAHVAAVRAPLAWQVVGAGPVSAAGVLCTQIRVAPDGELRLAYQDLTSPAHRLALRRFDGVTWSPLSTAGAGSVGTAWYNRMAFLPDGALIVATRDYGLAGRIGVRRCDGPGAPWTPLGAASPSPSDAHYTDVATLPGGRVAVAYQDRSTVPADRATVALWTGGSWGTISGPGLSQGVSAYTSLDVAPDGTLLAAFTDSQVAGRAVVLAWSESTGGWEPRGQPGFTPDIPNNLVLRVAPDGTPYVAYYVWNTRIIVRRFDGAGWPAVGLEVDGADVPAVETEGWRQWLAFEIDATGRPVLAYQARNRGGRAVVKRFESAIGAWETLGEPGFTPGAADYLSLALAADGTPYVAFRDGPTGRALVYGWR